MKLELPTRMIVGASRLTAPGLIAAAIALILPVPPRAHGADEPVATPAPQRAIEPAAPVIPGSLVAALQGGEYEAARRSLIALRDAAKSDDDRAYFAFLQAISERLAGQREAARDTLRAAIAANPNGRWSAKIRYELAGIELVAGNMATAEELARGEAAQLLDGNRKDRLAGVYQSFAQKLLEPGDPLIKPDPNGAYELLVQGRELASSKTLRARFLLAMGQVSMAANDNPRAIGNFSEYLTQHPEGADRFTAGCGWAWRSVRQTSPCRHVSPGPIWHAISSD